MKYNNNKNWLHVLAIVILSNLFAGLEAKEYLQDTMINFELWNIDIPEVYVIINEVKWMPDFMIAKGVVKMNRKNRFTVLRGGRLQLEVDWSKNTVVEFYYNQHFNQLIGKYVIRGYGKTRYVSIDFLNSFQTQSKGLSEVLWVGGVNTTASGLDLKNNIGKHDIYVKVDYRLVK